jgi:Ankyrin repeats (many copies)
LENDGADVNHKEGSGETPLHSVIRAGNPDIVSIMLEHGAVVGFGKFVMTMPDTVYMDPALIVLLGEADDETSIAGKSCHQGS